MPAVKPLDRISDKWARVAAVSTPEYEAGIANPRRPWAEATADAESSYEQGVQAAISRKAFAKGVRNAGNAKWQNAAMTKGKDRWAAGIAGSKEAYSRGFAPYRTVIENVQLPARGPKGDPKNIQRVAIIAKALHDAKLANG